MVPSSNVTSIVAPGSPVPETVTVPSGLGLAVDTTRFSVTPPTVIVATAVAVPPLPSSTW